MTNTFFFHRYKNSSISSTWVGKCVPCSPRFSHRWVISRSRFQKSSGKSFDVDPSHVLQLPQFSTIAAFNKGDTSREKVNITGLVAYSWCVSKRTMTSLSPPSDWRDCGPPSVPCVSDGWFCCIYLWSNGLCHCRLIKLLCININNDDLHLVLLLSFHCYGWLWSNGYLARYVYVISPHVKKLRPRDSKRHP